MKKVVMIAFLLAFSLLVMPVFAQGGFDEFGYNYKARVFVGTAYSWGKAREWTDDQIYDYFGPYMYDKVVMKWNAEWDRGNAEDWKNPPYDAWETNEWNGAFPGGSGAVWHYKIIWVGTELENSPYWREGGYSIWGQFEVIMDQGIDPNIGPGHIWFALATPNGFGAP
jgi:hypothetical protein